MRVLEEGKKLKWLKVEVGKRKHKKLRLNGNASDPGGVFFAFHGARPKKDLKKV